MKNGPIELRDGSWTTITTYQQSRSTAKHRSSGHRLLRPCLRISAASTDGVQSPEHGLQPIPEEEMPVVRSGHGGESLGCYSQDDGAAVIQSPKYASAGFFPPLRLRVRGGAERRSVDFPLSLAVIRRLANYLAAPPAAACTCRLVLAPRERQPASAMATWCRVVARVH